MKLDENNKAWMVLTEDEQLSLRLNLGLKKSTWKSGEIMRKSHYKLIEIKDRAKKFLKIFQYHFDEYGQLIPEGIRISADLKEYFELTIIKRMSVSKAVQEIDNPLYRHISSRDSLMISEITPWKNSIKIPERDFYNLVMEFDRWNNFRIIPRPLQEPSAFKRRDKNKLKKHLKIGTSLPRLAFKIIKKRFTHTSRHEINEAYLSLITVMNKKGVRKTEVIRICANKENVDELSKASLYLFPSLRLAEEYGELVLNFIDKNERHCIDGLKFWPLYRALIQRAINYGQIQNITPSRKNLEFSLHQRTDKKYF